MFANASTMSSVQVFIPFIVSSMNKEAVVNLFNTLALGNVTDIDMHTKHSSRARSSNNGTGTALYSYAFLKVQPYNTEGGVQLSKNVAQREATTVHYDPEDASQHWEIKPYLSVEQRHTLGYAVAASALVKTAGEDAVPEWYSEDNATASNQMDMHFPPLPELAESNVIRNLCADLLARPTVFNDAQIRADIDADYYEIQQDIATLMNAPAFSLWRNMDIFRM